MDNNVLNECFKKLDDTLHHDNQRELNNNEISILLGYINGLEEENKRLKEYCCKRNDCSGRLKENHKLTGYEIINELEKWLEEQYSYYSHLPISLSTDRRLLYQEVLEKLKKLKGSDK